eukprot:9484976-Pyramimonas_sp.AAC.1
MQTTGEAGRMTEHLTEAPRVHQRTTPPHHTTLRLFHARVYDDSAGIATTVAASPSNGGVAWATNGASSGSPEGWHREGGASPAACAHKSTETHQLTSPPNHPINAKTAPVPNIGCSAPRYTPGAPNESAEALKHLPKPSPEGPLSPSVVGAGSTAANTATVVSMVVFQCIPGAEAWAARRPRPI